MNLAPNGDFEAGDTGWDKGAGWAISNTGPAPHAGSYSAKYTGTGPASINSTQVPFAPGQTLSVSAWINSTSFADSSAAVGIEWYDASHSVISYSTGLLINANTGVWQQSTYSQVAPAGTAYATVFVSANATSSGVTVSADDIQWNYAAPDRTATLTSPVAGASFVVGSEVLLSVNIGGTTPAVTSVVYKQGSTVLATVTTPDYSYNINTLVVGSYTVFAIVTFADASTITTNTAAITITALPVPVVTREYKASNAYTYMLAQNFGGLSSAIPSVAKIIGVELVVDYKIRALIRSKDLGIVDPLGSNSSVAFDITDGGVLEATLLDPNGTTYDAAGYPITLPIPLDRTDFTLVETMTSENKKWTVMDSVDTSVTMGGPAVFFGLTPAALSDFLTRSIGFRFLPNILTKPAYADSGDCCFRFFINQIKMRVYFDAGSALYYFASPDKTQCLEGTLVSANITKGDFRTGDASGELQLQPTLVIKDGTTTCINGTWTIHAAYPPTTANQIGNVFPRDKPDALGMAYNGLPSTQNIITNRSRFEFITTNFFAVSNLNSIYGVNGLSRAFSYNGDYFYTIWTQPDASKDQPRHIANNQGSLALGFNDGRVDISVAGQPYNYSGILGASEWSIGDPIVGLVPLVGNILGVFGKKSVWGISGSTVNNYAVQVLSPNIGAIEYTVVDIGGPIYANSFGIYTLDQTERYGDYIGNPLSQNISPWLRPRMIRSITSNKEVVVAWPVRTKNQYRLAFSDGYVLSMTLDITARLLISYMPRGYVVATFSFQKYFYTPDNWAAYTSYVPQPDLYSYPTIVPIAVSSELDVTGEERIHIASMPVTTVIYSPPDDTAPLPLTYRPYVYELEKGWSFDGNYIPHFVETNWFFGQDPTTYSGIQKTRIHGLTKGNVNLEISTNGIQTDYESDFTLPQYIDLPSKPMYLNPDYQLITNYAETVNRGIAIQFRIEGRNTDYTLPEPSHVIQVLALETSPQGTGAKAN